MSDRSRLKEIATYLAVAYFIAMALAVSFPGIIPFNTIRPYVFGVPFVFVWYLCWILGSLLMFTFLYAVFNE
jgi:hypothetical protein